MKITAYIYYPKIISPTDPRIDAALRDTAEKFKKLGDELGATCWINDCDIVDDDTLHVIF